MNQRPQDLPEYEWLREFKRLHGHRLRSKYGAHGMGIGWKRKGGRKTDQLALLFYVEHKSGEAKAADAMIPPAFSFAPNNHEEPVTLVTDVIETPPDVEQ